jgi:SAM-dependent methyltransferase
MMAETGIDFPLVEAFGEDVPLPDGSFDLAVSEHGAATWADPYRWIPEAARMLRRGGRLVFMHSSPLAMVCSPDEGEIGRTLERPYLGMHRFEWPDGSVEFQLSHGGWIDVLHENGFEIERLVEVQEIWAARKRP